MNNLKVLTTAVALLFVTPVLAQEMGGATGPGSASGLEATYNNGYYNGYGQGGHLRAGGGALDGNNAYALSPGDGDCAQRYRSYDPASGTYAGHAGQRHSCQ
ncbi:MAG TPA: BA14K family protein [Pyrinomonadaceae bacterium]|nr:BA14K family protein [Pyrinomonadaceae bacterium]